MTKLNLATDFAKLITDVLDFKEGVVDEWFDITEGKDGYFTAKLMPKKWLSDLQFKAMCALSRDLGGDYVKAEKSFRVPGPLAKSPSEHGTGSEPTYKEPRNAFPSGSTKSPRAITIIPIKALLSMPFQSRTVQEGPELDELAESIKTLGVMSPILVRPKEGGLFEIVYGERRVAAAKKLGLLDVPANVKPLTDMEAYEIQLVENVQRKDLSDMEKARFLDMMIKKFNYTQEQLAKKLGKTQGWISHHLSMLKIPENITRVIMNRKTEGEFTEGQAREILAASPEKREEIIDKINETGKVPPAREIHEIAHPDEKPKLPTALFHHSVPCAYCKEQTPHPFIAPDKNPYCSEEHYEYAKEAAEEALSHEDDETEQSHEEGEKEETKDEKEPSSSEKENLLNAVQIGEFECTECHKHLYVDHMPDGRHRLRQFKEITK